MQNCMVIQRQIISVKFKFSNVRELNAHDTRKKILFTKCEGCSCFRKRVINTFYFPHMSVNFAWTATILY